MKRRVLFLPSYYPSDARPVDGIFVEEQALALSALYDVAVLALDLTVGWRRWMRGLGTQASTTEVRAGLRVVRERSILPSARRPWNMDGRYDRMSAQGFDRLVREWGRAELIHAFAVLPAGLAAVRLGRREGIPVVLSEMTGPFSVHLATPRLRRATQEALSGVVSVAAMAPPLAREVEAASPGVKVRVIPPVVRTEWIGRAEDVPSRAAAGHRFLAIGGLIPAKGFTFLLQAVRRILDWGCAPFSVEIIGDGPERGDLEREAATLGVTSQVRFRGNVSREELHQSLHACDALVHPTLCETFGLVQAEAMACGKPVVATRCDGPEFVVEKGCGILVPPRDAGALADAMASILSGKARFDSARIRASAVERFGTDAFLQKVVSWYDSAWGKG